MNRSEEEAASETIASPTIGGVQTGTHRGKYKKNSSEQRTWVISPSEELDGNWKSIAKANGVEKQTAFDWWAKTERSLGKCEG